MKGIIRKMGAIGIAITIVFSGVNWGVFGQNDSPKEALESTMKVALQEKDKLSVDAEISILDKQIKEIELFLDGNSIERKKVEEETLVFSLYCNGEYQFKGLPW